MNADFLALAGIALMFLLPGVFAFVYTRGRLRLYRRLAALATATGQVVSVTRNNDRRHTMAVEYQDAQGIPLVAICSLGAAFDVGSTVTVAYDPFDSSRGLVKEEIEKGARGGKIVAAVFVGLGAVVLAFAIVGSVHP